MITAVLKQPIFFFALRHGIDMYQIITFLADTRRQLTLASRAAMLVVFIHLVYLFFRMNILSLFFLFPVKYISSLHAFFSDGSLFKCYCNLTICILVSFLAFLIVLCHDVCNFKHFYKALCNIND